MSLAPEWSLLTTAGCALCLAFLIYSTNKEDSVTSSSSWWATRPISSEAVFLSKLMLWFVAVGLPLGLTTAAVALRFQLSGAQTLLSVMEVLFISATFAGMVATFVSLTNRSIASSLLVGGFFSFVMVASLATMSAGANFQAVGLPANPLRARSDVVGLIILTGASVGAWWLRIACRKQGLAGFVLLGGILFFGIASLGARQGLSTKFQLPAADASRISVRLLDPPSPVSSNLLGTQLYNHFIFSGLRTNEFASLDWISASFQWPDGSTGSVMELTQGPGTSLHQYERWELSQLEPILFAYFPRSTSWVSEWNHRRATMFGISHPDESVSLSSKTSGNFEGTIQANIHRLAPIRTIPLRAAIYQLDSGRSIDLQEVAPEWDSIRLQFSLTRPKLALSNDPEINLATPYQREDTRYVFVVYHPAMNEAYLLENRYPSRHQSFRSLIPISKQAFALNIPFSSLQSALNGFSMTDWIEDAELRVFKIETVGNTSHEFAENSYRPYPVSSQSETETASLTQLQLPENPSTEDIETFIRAINAKIPDRASYESAELIRQKYESLPPEHLPLLLGNLPEEDAIVNTYLAQTISENIRSEHLPALKKVWATRDLFLTEIRRHDWEVHVRGTLIQRISQRQPVSPTAVAIVAEAGDPATYSDLRWHFINSRWGHESLLRAFQQCEGLNTDDLVRESWQRARLDLIHPDGLSLAAARLGLPDALRFAVAYMEKLEGDRRDELRQKIRQLTTHEGPVNEFETWLQNHLGKLVFSSTIQKYIEPSL